MGRVLSGGVGLALTGGPRVGHWKGIRSDAATFIGGGASECKLLRQRLDCGPASDLFRLGDFHSDLCRWYTLA